MKRARHVGSGGRPTVVFASGRGASGAGASWRTPGAAQVVLAAQVASAAQKEGRLDVSRRAVVLEVGPEKAVVLLEGGAVRRLALHGRPLTVGQEIWVPDGAAVWANSRGRAAAAIATAAIVGGGYLAFRPQVPPVAAWVSVDINPSVGLALSAAGRVVKVEGLDAAGTRMAAALPHLSGEPLGNAVAALVTEARQEGYLGSGADQSSFIVVAGAPTAGAEEVFAADQIKAAAGALASLAEASHATLVTLPEGKPADVQAAASYHLSLGRYLLGKLTRIPWGRMKYESLADVLDQWPFQTRRQLGRPRSKPSSASSTSSVPPTSTSTSPAPSSSAGAPPSSSPPATASVTTVAGVLEGVGPDTVMINGTVYSVTRSAILSVGGYTVPLSLPMVFLLENQTVKLTLQAGVVVRITASATFKLPSLPPPFPSATLVPTG